MDRSEIEREVDIPRAIKPQPIRADYYEGDKIQNGSYVQEAHSAVLGINNKLKSTGILAGTLDRHNDVGAGGKSESIGVLGISNKGIGVWCESNDHEALHAETKSTETAAIAAYNINPESNSTALYAKKYGSNGSAAVFDGDVNIVIGNLNVKSGLITINGESIWDLIYKLQLEVEKLKNNLSNTNQIAVGAAQTANSANNTANNANNTANKALEKANS